MSESLRAEQRGFLPLHLLILLLCLSWGVIPSQAQGENVEGKLESSRQQTEKEKHEHYEIIVPYLLRGEEWEAIGSVSTKSHPPAMKVLLKAKDIRLLISLERNKGLFAGNFSTTHYTEDGVFVSTALNYTDHCYYHGKVEGYSESSVSVSSCSGLRGLITLENRAYVLEPQANSTTSHLFYQAEHLKLISGSCSQHFNLSGVSLSDNFQHSQDTFKRHKRDTVKTTKYVELVIVADNREYQRQGKDVDKVKHRLIGMANYVDKFFRPLNIRVALVGVEIWSDSDKCSITQDPFTTLQEFLDWRKLKLLPQKPHDNAQLVSGVYFQGTTIGMAPIMSMCTADKSGGIVMDHSGNPLGAAVTLAHELGHNFGMNHDTLERGCNCRGSADNGGCIMTPSTAYPFPTVFSSCGKKDLDSSLEKGVGMCLYNMPEVTESFGEQKCGNGYVEEGEQCDCGEPDECTNPCCNASLCMLKPGAVCAHGLCCEDCKLKPAGTPCRDANNFCDLPEFCSGTSAHCPANVYLHDGHPCFKIEGYCYNGVCQTHEQQCITLWGQGAKPAPGICFERVNSAGDPYGNCGKDSTGSFTKCENRDAKCGKIQCQGGANRPVIGTNAVSIETNIPLQEGRRILCRGTHVYLGDDLPDPGLVLAGTKCEEGKICLNRKCQNISIFGVHDCALKCHGHGVCNNKKNCHCEAEWAPPFCDKHGFGGSVDSGPVRLHDNRSLITGMIVTIGCIFLAAFIVYLKRKTLFQWLFSNKKTTIEKLRSVRPSRGGCSNEPNQEYRTALSKHVLSKPACPPKEESSIQYNTRLPRCHPIDISHPIRILELPQHSLPRKVQAPLHSLPFQQTVPARPLPAKPSVRCLQGSCIPSPPQKPLPAVPLNKTSQSDSALGTMFEHREHVPRITPVRPAPKCPPQQPGPTKPPQRK
ncbi:disintegrin and metalloproteinase domain-containing protein 12 precursor [Xenopus tropicalis]|uniref:ADAM12 n=1 Tax=Xenopus tropicalis TaxID=8364 RepID=Q27JK7_XENTR|nr:disintegrin and metalloproteinase domain-containing protein 12 precursor [Xenopus tropicalis]ABD52382.1 ADAM12 [Xenopus tropicalis]|eukprot:NP_001035103.1 disintegrin and metalloproteinase domain-containing protein 12 precursor [Xenopus tropicalis]